MKFFLIFLLIICVVFISAHHYFKDTIEDRCKETKFLNAC